MMAIVPFLIFAMVLVPVFSSQAISQDAAAMEAIQPRAINTVAFSSDATQAISGGYERTLRLWDIKTGLLLRAFDTQMAHIYAVAFSPDNRRILAGGAQGSLQLFERATGATVLSFTGHTEDVRSVAFSNDGRLVLSGSTDKTLKLWDAHTGLLLKTYEGHSEAVLAVSLSADARRALSGSKDKTLKVWDVESAAILKTLIGHTDDVISIMLSNDGTRAVSGSGDHLIKLWDIESGQTLNSIAGHTSAVLSVTFSPDGQQILSASRDKTWKVWTIQSGDMVYSFDGHMASVTATAFAMNGRLILSGSYDKTLKFWDVTTRKVTRTIDLQTLNFHPNGYFGFGEITSLPDAPKPVPVAEKLIRKGFDLGAPVFLRIFKADLVAELWIKKGQHFELFETYPICAWSGQIGPKLAQGDLQSPEGFYTVRRGQLNPNSQFYRSFNLGFPNLLDRENNRTGTFLMVHGSCVSIGCYAMTNPIIAELWELITAAFDKGQTSFWVHVFPYRMTEDRRAAFSWHAWSEFWDDLKPAYDLFEETRIPPKISVCNKRYVVTPGNPKTGIESRLTSACPIPNVRSRALAREYRRG